MMHVIQMSAKLLKRLIL